MENKKNKQDRLEPLFILKPLIINAFFPLFMKNLLVSLILSTALFGISLILALFNINILPFTWSIIIFILLAVVLAILPLTLKIFKLAFTKYIFYENNVVKEFRFIMLKRKSAIYQRVTNISLEISIWDKLCGAGDIKLHTDDDDPDIVLEYIKKPEEVEHKIYSLIRKENKEVNEN